jgi:hypothetical protein
VIPASAKEYAEIYMANLEMTGFGIEGLTEHFPCPFCAARDWYIVRLIAFQTSTDPIECEACGRSARFIFNEDAGGPMQGGSKTMRLVQTGGPDPPHWLDPPPPRERASGRT